MGHWTSGFHKDGVSWLVSFYEYTCKINNFVKVVFFMHWSLIRKRGASSEDEELTSSSNTAATSRGARLRISRHCSRYSPPLTRPDPLLANNCFMKPDTSIISLQTSQLPASEEKGETISNY
jgi:hypothetical protein